MLSTLLDLDSSKTKIAVSRAPTRCSFLGGWNVGVNRVQHEASLLSVRNSKPRGPEESVGSRLLK
jgi:hypothetical protein